MGKSKTSQKETIINILQQSFMDNRSVNYIIKQDKYRNKRIRALMNYSYEMCKLFGEVLISEDESACALIVYPEKKKTTIKSLVLDLKLVFLCVGLKNLQRTLHREAVIRKRKPKVHMAYLWFIGVDMPEQSKGHGTRLMQYIIQESAGQGRVVCLETSTERNISWYQKLGFEIYAEEDFSYRLYFLKR